MNNCHVCQSPAVSGIFISARLSPLQPFLRQEIMIRPSNKNLDSNVDPDSLSSVSLSADAGVCKPTACVYH